MTSGARRKLDSKQIAELREIFRSFDRNRDGSLSQAELGAMLRSLGLKPSREHVDALAHQADLNRNGLVEFSEFVALVEPDLLRVHCPYGQDQLRAVFRMFDRDGDGFVSPDELALSMAELGRAVTADEVAGMVKEADIDGDGRIDFGEFARVISSAAFDNSWC